MPTPQVVQNEEEEDNVQQILLKILSECQHTRCLHDRFSMNHLIEKKSIHNIKLLFSLFNEFNESSY